jgi:hypothetical protein
MATEGNSDMPRQFVFILCALFLAACQPVSQPTPTINVPAIRTVAAETARAEMTQTAAPSLTPSPSKTPTPIPSSTIDLTAGMPTAFVIPSPTPLSTIAPSEIPGLLQNALAIESGSFNGHAIRMVTGWAYGFKNFEWRGESHLQVSAIVGKIPNSAPWDGILTHDAIINPGSGKTWLPAAEYPRWLPELGQFMVTQSESTEVFNLNGELVKTYPGVVLDVSPSGTKFLFSDGTWLDLLSGKTVKFAWEQNYDYYKPSWSADETLVAVCCFAYGNAKTGESFEQISLPAGDPNIFSPGKWTFDNRYILGIKNFTRDLYVSPPLFNISTKSMHTVGELTGIPTKIDGDANNMCNRWFVAPNGKYVWISCFDGDHLVDLITFKSWDYPKPPLSPPGTDVDWTGDSNFARVIIDDDFQNPHTSILSVASKKLMPVPEGCNLQWPPIGNMLVCQSKTESALSILDIQTMAVQKELKPAPDCKYLEHFNDGLFLCKSENLQALSLLDAKTLSTQHEIELEAGILSAHKSPEGNHLALLAQDGSLWQIDYPSLENLEQLTEPMPPKIMPSGGQEPRVKDIAWSPDGRYLAFLGDTDIYIVDTHAVP